MTEAPRSGGTPRKVAIVREMRVRVFPADWKRYGRSAGMRRNAEIVAAADAVVAFWDRESPGTKHTIDLARRAGKLERIIMEPLGVY